MQFYESGEGTFLRRLREVEDTDDFVMMFNETLHEVGHRKVDLERPKYADLNWTNEFQTISVTYPRSRFMRGSCAPIISGEKAQQEQLSVTAIGTSIFDPNTTMVTCDPHQDKGMTRCCSRNNLSTINEAFMDSILPTPPGTHHCGGLDQLRTIGQTSAHFSNQRVLTAFGRCMSMGHSPLHGKRVA